jgi:hypothetical protein
MLVTLILTGNERISCAEIGICGAVYHLIKPIPLSRS